MGITYSVARFLLEAPGPREFGSTLTLGRQQLFLNESQLRTLVREFRAKSPEPDQRSGNHAESFLTDCVGATTVSSLDFSPYEGATIIHDMNHEIDSKLQQNFDTLIDAGTLEHIFNFPVALSNCMRMLRVGGRFFLCSPANSLMGHGFYQFSPELLYRSLSSEHGFEVQRMRVVRSKYVSTELDTLGEPLDVVDPQDAGTRIIVSSQHPLSIMVCARKTRHLDDPFATPPQQSDYVQAWAAIHPERPALPAALDLVERVWSKLPSRLKWKLWNEYGRWYRHTVRNRAWFKKPGAV